MKVLALIVGLLLLGSPVFGQQSVVSQVKAELEAAGVSLSGPCGAFEITKRVVWLKRDEGYGLLGGKSPAQNGCVVGADKYAADWLLKANGDGIDILKNAGGNPNNPNEPANVPTWEEGTADPALYRQAIDPNSGAPTPVPVPQPPNIDIVGKLDKIADDLARIEAKVEQTDADVNQGRKEVAEFRSAVRERWLAVTKFAGKYILPAIAAYLAGTKL